jgi:hypothetical protein
MVTKTMNPIDAAREQLAAAERKLAEVNAEVTRLEAQTRKEWEDSRAFQRVSTELDRMIAGRERLTSEVGGLRAEIRRLAEEQRQGEIDALRRELTELRTRDGEVLASLRAAIKALVTEHFELQTAERKIVNMLKRDYGVGEQMRILGDPTLAPFPLRSWGIPANLLRDQTVEPLPSAAALAAAIGVRRDRDLSVYQVPGVGGHTGGNL